MKNVYLVLFAAALTLGLGGEPEYGEELCLADYQEPETNEVAGVCEAYTTCANGGSIYCYASGQGCSWYVQPYEYVTCTGWIGGFWQTVSYSCR